MALSKIQTGLVDTNAIGSTELNLADNFAFTGDVSGAGNLLQVVTEIGNTLSQVATATITRVGVEAVITPTASTSKILVLCNATCRWAHGDAGFVALHRKIGSGSW